MSINAEIFDKLAADAANEKRARDAVNEYTIGFMYTRWTKQPKRGFFRMIMPSIPLYPVTVLQERGWPYNPEEVSVAGVPHAPHRYDAGDAPYYELVERDLSEEDYQLRLLLRLVPKWEWRSRASSARKWARRRREHPRPSWEAPGEEKDAFFRAIMRRLAGLICGG